MVRSASASIRTAHEQLEVDTFDKKKIGAYGNSPESAYV